MSVPITVQDNGLGHAHIMADELLPNKHTVSFSFSVRAAAHASLLVSKQRDGFTMGRHYLTGGVAAATPTFYAQSVVLQ